MLTFYQKDSCPGGFGGDETTVDVAEYAGKDYKGLRCATNDGVEVSGGTAADSKGLPVDVGGAGYLTIPFNMTSNCQFHWYNDSRCGDDHWIGYLTAAMQQLQRGCMNLTDPEGNSLVNIIHGLSYVCS